jgi:hypothetical protein
MTRRTDTSCYYCIYSINARIIDQIMCRNLLRIFSSHPHLLTSSTKSGPIITCTHLDMKYMHENASIPATLLCYWFALLRDVQNVIAILRSDSWLSFQPQQRTLLTTTYRRTAHRRQAHTNAHRLSIHVLVLILCRSNTADCSINWTLETASSLNSSTQLTWEKSLCFKLLDTYCWGSTTGMVIRINGWASEDFRSTPGRGTTLFSSPVHPDRSEAHPVCTGDSTQARALQMNIAFNQHYNIFRKNKATCFG